MKKIMDKAGNFPYKKAGRITMKLLIKIISRSVV